MNPTTDELIELAICGKLIDDALAAGYEVSVYDGGAYPLLRSTDRAAIIAAMRSTDGDTLIFHNAGARIGWVQLVYGNGHDVIADNTDNTTTNELLRGAEALAEELALTAQ